MKTGRIGQRGPQDIAPPDGVTLAGIDQRRVIEHVLPYHWPDQETDVEAVPGDLAAESEGKVGVGVANDAVIGGGRVATDRRLSVHAPGRGRCAEELLLPVRVDAQEHGAVERPQGLPPAIPRPTWVADHDAFRPYTALTLSADVSGLVVRARLEAGCCIGSAPEVSHLAAVRGEDE